MDIAGQIASYTYQYFDNLGFLLLSGIGLIVIYGVMGVINMAHGELMMIGAYIAVSTFYAGVPARRHGRLLAKLIRALPAQF